MLKYLKKYWIFALIAPLFMMGEVLMDLIQPRLMRTIVDEGVLGIGRNGVGDMSIILYSGAIMIGTVIFGGICGVMSGIFANLCSQNFGNDVRKACFRKIMALSFQQTDEFSTGSLVTRVTNDVTQVQNMVAQLIRGCVRTAMFFIGGIACMMSLDISFGVTVLCTLPLVLASVLFFISKANPSFKILQKKIDRVNTVMQENVSGARVVKAYVREQHEAERFQEANHNLVQVQLKVLELFAFMTPITNILLNATIVIIIKIGAVRVSEGIVTPGSVMAAITYISMIMHSVMMIAMIFQTFSRGMVSAGRLKEILVCEPVIQDGIGIENCESANNNVDDLNSRNQQRQTGTIEFRDVSFAYPDSPDDYILEHINLSIRSGETFAILGGTGCGKTSLVQLIPRFYDVTEGELLVDGRNVKSYNLKELRDKVSIALQKSELFTMSIEDNIRWGKMQASNDEVQHVAEMSQAAEFIDAKPEGMKSLVAEGGMSLSGGQKQRTSIARALLKNAEVLILDDSTSALDLKTEAKINNALQTDYEKTTKIIIAQRIASVMRADRIAVLDQGRIAACGNHEELMKSCAIYQDIYNSQLKTGGVSDGR